MRNEERDHFSSPPRTRAATPGQGAVPQVSHRSRQDHCDSRCSRRVSLHERPIAPQGVEREDVDHVPRTADQQERRHLRGEPGSLSGPPVNLRLNLSARLWFDPGRCRSARLGTADMDPCPHPASRQRLLRTTPTAPMRRQPAHRAATARSDATAADPAALPPPDLVCPDLSWAVSVALAGPFEQDGVAPDTVELGEADLLT